ncbi:MAG: hypothetical protein Q7R85_04410 [bacterium]|nr:hypothetical protein [bacterium]
MESSQKRTLLIDVGIPVAGLLAFVVFTAVLRLDMARRVETIAGLRQMIVSRTQAVQTLASLRADAERARIYSSVLGNILPSRDQLISFPKEFELIAKKYNVRLAAAFGAEAVASGGEPGAIDFSFQMKGAYPDIVAFLAAAESSRYILGWTSFEFLKDKLSDYNATVFGRVFTK